MLTKYSTEDCRNIDIMLAFKIPLMSVKVQRSKVFSHVGNLMCLGMGKESRTNQGGSEFRA